MGGAELTIAGAALLCGLAGAVRGGASRLPSWRSRVAVAADTVSLAVVAIVVASRPLALLETPLLLVAIVSLGDCGLAVLQLRGAAGREPPRWLV